MSRRFRQLTNFFSTGDYDAAAIEQELKSDAPANGNPKTFTWDNANIWRDLESGRNAIHIAAGMTVKIKGNAKFVVNFDANLLGRRAFVVYKFDAFKSNDDYLFTFVTRRQSLETDRFTAAAKASPPKARGIVDDIRVLDDLNEVSYLIRRGGGKYQA